MAKRTRFNPVRTVDGVYERRCYQCKEWKTRDGFGKDSSRPDGVRTQCKDCERAYRKANAAVARERHRKYYEANREKVIARTTGWQQANRHLMREYYRKHEEVHKERRLEKNRAYREANRELIREREAARRALNPEKTRRDQQARRAALRGVEHDPSVTTESLRDRDGDYCCYCGTLMLFEYDSPYNDQAVTLEHVRPISRGGGHVWENTALCCRRCNLSKRSSLFLWQWVAVKASTT